MPLQPPLSLFPPYAFAPCAALDQALSNLSCRKPHTPDPRRLRPAGQPLPVSALPELQARKGPALPYPSDYRGSVPCPPLTSPARESGNALHPPAKAPVSPPPAPSPTVRSSPDRQPSPSSVTYSCERIW